jgi:hypothetical protein
LSLVYFLNLFGEYEKGIRLQAGAVPAAVSSIFVADLFLSLSCLYGMGRLRTAEQARRPAIDYFRSFREKSEELLIQSHIMKTRLNFLAWAMLIFLFISGCKKYEETVYNRPAPYAHGAFISNEGTFGQANASVGFYDFAGDSVRNSIFTTVNKIPLGQLLPRSGVKMES